MQSLTLRNTLILKKKKKRERERVRKSKNYMGAVMSDFLWSHGLYPIRSLCPWNSSSKSTGVGCHDLLQGTFLTQGSNLGLLHCRQILYHLSHLGSHKKIYGLNVIVIFSRYTNTFCFVFIWKSVGKNREWLNSKKL